MNSLAKTDFFDDFFDHFLTHPVTHRDYLLESTDTNYNVTIELPGFTKENLEIEVIDLALRVSAKNGTGLREKVSRTWTLPRDANPEEISADLIDGLLKIKIARAGPKKVLVEVS